MTVDYSKYGLTIHCAIGGRAFTDLPKIRGDEVSGIFLRETGSRSNGIVKNQDHGAVFSDMETHWGHGKRRENAKLAKV